jgi:probable rRNA maturation factor
VLAFPLDAPGEGHPGVPSILGDVVIAPAVAARQAQEAGRSEDDELAVLVVHGVLHLLGHDHAEEDERRVMFRLTDELLSDFRGRIRTGGAS